MEVQDVSSNQNNTNQPAFTDRRGRLRLAVWANQTDKGVRFSSEITRTWKDGDEFRSTTRLDEQDLLAAARLAQLADDWITSQRD